MKNTSDEMNKARSARGKHYFETMQKARRMNTVLIDSDGKEHIFTSRTLACSYLSALTGRTVAHIALCLRKGDFQGFRIKQ